MLKSVTLSAMAAGLLILPGIGWAQQSRPAIRTLIAGDLVTVDRISLSAEGQIAVWQAEDNLIRRFDADGNELPTVGHNRGPAPGLGLPQ
jgi:hypothetical protein